MHALAEQYAALGEENRIGTMADLLNFHRDNNESVDELLSRFDPDDGLVGRLHAGLRHLPPGPN